MNFPKNKQKQTKEPFFQHGKELIGGCLLLLELGKFSNYYSFAFKKEKKVNDF